MQYYLKVSFYAGPMHKKQVKKQNVNQVGIHKNTPTGKQITFEEFDEFVNSYLKIKSYDEIFELLNYQEEDVPTINPIVTEDMLYDCLLDEDVKITASPNSTPFDIEDLFDTINTMEVKDASLLYSDNYNKLLELYYRQKEINKRNCEVIRDNIGKTMAYFGNEEFLRDIDTAIENTFKKKKYKKSKKGNKIFDRSVKAVDTSGADELMERRKEFKDAFPSLRFPVQEDLLLEDNVDIKQFNTEECGFMKY